MLLNMKTRLTCALRVLKSPTLRALESDEHASVVRGVVADAFMMCGESSQEDVLQYHGCRRRGFLHKEGTLVLEQ